MIQTNNSIVKQNRNHPDIYLNKVTEQQSKYIALHVGLFWGIGKFIIKNGDAIKIVIQDEEIFNQLYKKQSPSDDFIKTRLHFILQLINQRKLKISYKFTDKEKGLL